MPNRFSTTRAACLKKFFTPGGVDFVSFSGRFRDAQPVSGAVIWQNASRPFDSNAS